MVFLKLVFGVFMYIILVTSLCNSSIFKHSKSLPNNYLVQMVFKESLDFTTEKANSFQEIPNWVQSGSPSKYPGRMLLESQRKLQNLQEAVGEVLTGIEEEIQELKEESEIIEEASAEGEIVPESEENLSSALVASFYFLCIL